jgi:hypothetical protein
LSGALAGRAAATPLLTGACAGALLAGVLALVFETTLTNGIATASVVQSLVNCAAAGSLVARCVIR